MSKIKVGIIGTGTIGHRVIAYGKRQKDMEICGVSKATPNDVYHTTAMLWKLGIPVYPSSRSGKDGLKKSLEEFRNYFNKIKDKEKIYSDVNELVPGTIVDLINESEVIVDTSAGTINKTSVPEYNKKEFYIPHNEKVSRKVRVIFQGGESASIGKISFNAAVNYDEAIEVGRSNEPYIRQVSCNTTALSRILYVFLENYVINRVYVVIVRRSTDPGEESKNILNDIYLGEHLPSHHGPDVEDVFKNFKNFKNLLDKQILTSAIKVTTDQMHAHDLTLTFPVSAPYSEENYPTKEKFIEICKNSILRNRIAFDEGVMHTSRLREFTRRKERMLYAKDKIFPTCGDIFAVTVGLNSFAFIRRTTVYRNKWIHLKLQTAVHQEAIVIPEIIDAIRALCYDKLHVSRDDSIRMTDESLGICNYDDV